MITPIKYKGRYWVPRAEPFIQYSQKDREYLRYILPEKLHQFREAVRGEGRTTADLEELVNLCNKQCSILFVCENTAIATKLFRYFWEVNSGSVFHRVRLEVEYNKGLVKFCSINQSLRGLRFTELVFHHSWNRDGENSVSIDHHNQQARKFLLLDLEKNRKRVCSQQISQSQIES